MKRQACEETGVKFLSLDEIKGSNQYQCGMNTTVYDSDGKPHTVDHTGIADHPGDAGMQWIVEQIVKVVKE